MVFGLALSIGALAMINQPIGSSHDVMQGIFQFAFGFIVIVSVWVSYTSIISDVKIETTRDFRINLGLLMLVAIEPYLLYLLGKNDDSILNFSSMAYAVDIGLIMLMLAALNHRKVQIGASEETKAQDQTNREVEVSVAIIFLVSALPIFWNITVFHIEMRFLLWALALLPGLVTRLLHLRFQSIGSEK
jgi:uncharacterized membrane protein